MVVLEPRIYRAALLPALLALFVLMFSLEPPPAPLPQEPAADVLFDSRSAIAEARAIASRRPDRRAGSSGNRASAEAVARALAARGFEVTRDAFGVDGRRLVNVLARRAGSSRRQIVVMAPRDARSMPDLAGSAADTAALLEVARVLEGRASRRTIVLASIDGSTLGDAGARRFLASEAELDQVDAVLVLSHLSAAGGGSSPLVAWSSDASRSSLALEQTVAASLALESGSPPPQEPAFAQLVRLAAPLGIGAQGPLLASDVAAIRLSGSGESPPTSSRPDVERFGELGRATLRTVAALDSGERADHGPPAYVVMGGQVVPGWALATLGLALILAPLAASIDALARVRRRGQPVIASFAWVLAGALAFMVALLVAQLLSLAGIGPGAARSPWSPARAPLDVAAAIVLAVSAVALASAWIAGRPWLLRRAIGRAGFTDPASPAAGVAVSLVAGLAVLTLWATNPFAGLLLAPLANAIALGALSGARARTGVALLLLGLLAPLGAALVYLRRLALDPLEGAWYGVGLATGGHVRAMTLLLSCVLLGALGSAAAIVLARARAQPPSSAVSRGASAGRPRASRTPSSSSERAVRLASSTTPASDGTPIT